MPVTKSLVAMEWLTSQSVWVFVFGCLAIALVGRIHRPGAVLRAMPVEDRAEAHTIASALMTAFAAAFVLLTVALIVNTSVVGTRGGLWAALVTTSLTVVIALSIALQFALATPWREAIQMSGHPIDAVRKDLNTNYFDR